MSDPTRQSIEYLVTTIHYDTQSHLSTICLEELARRARSNSSSSQEPAEYYGGTVGRITAGHGDMRTGITVQFADDTAFKEGDRVIITVRRSPLL